MLGTRDGVPNEPAAGSTGANDSDRVQVHAALSARLPASVSVWSAAVSKASAAACVGKYCSRLA
jgi:hypothetical protein